MYTVLVGRYVTGKKRTVYLFSSRMYYNNLAVDWMWSSCCVNFLPAKR